MDGEQIIKALECCKTGQCHNGCPLLDFCNEQDVLAGSSKLCGDALSLIKELIQTNEEIGGRVNMFFEETVRLEKQLKELTEENETLTIQRNAWALTAKAIQADTVRKMQERLKTPLDAVACYWVDKIAEEMLEDC